MKLILIAIKNVLLIVFKPYGATPGHGIEWARLIVQWAYSSYKDTPDSAEVYLKAAEKLYNRAVEDSWNVDGNPGIVYTTDWDGKPVVHDRMHWTLAEAINTSAVLWHITHKQKYAKDYEEFMRYLDDKVLDHKNGSWFHQLDENNNVIGTVWPGKSDVYHAFQSTWIPYGTPYISIASDVNSIWKYAINKASVYLYPAYKISVKCSQNLTEQGSGCILLQDDKKNDVGNYFLISGWNSFTSLAISPLNRSMQIRFGIAISALAISEKFHTRAPGPPETMAVATPTIFPVPMVAASAVVSAEKGDTSPCPRLLVRASLLSVLFSA